MSFKFTSEATVPPDVISDIGNAIGKKFSNALNMCTEDLSTDMHNFIMIHFYNAVIDLKLQEFRRISGWYKLTSSQTETIAVHLLKNQRIYAIREFRRATEVGIREAKEFLENFECGDNGYEKFKEMFNR